jgi:hypothetical protein
MSNISSWSTTAASNNAATPDGWPEGMAPSSINNCGREMMAAIRTWFEDAQWINLGHTPTKVDGDTFTLSGDQTATYEAGRRLKMTGSSTAYGTILSSSYSAPNTTVNLTSSAIPNTLSTVSVGILTETNGAGLVDTGTFTGTLTGYATPPTGTVNYLRSKGLVTLWITSAITGTSNSVNLTMTGLPSNLQPANNVTVLSPAMRSDATTGGGAALGTASINGGTITFGLGKTSGGVLIATAGVWDNTGTKGLNAGWSITYPLA